MATLGANAVISRGHFAAVPPYQSAYLPICQGMGAEQAVELLRPTCLQALVSLSHEL